MKGYDANADSLLAQAEDLRRRPVSSHAMRVGRVYKTSAIVPDHVIPRGLQRYCRAMLRGSE
jgi:hypothetical protein